MSLLEVAEGGAGACDDSGKWEIGRLATRKFQILARLNYNSRDLCGKENAPDPNHAACIYAGQ